MVDELSGRALRVPPVDIRRADFQLERRRHAIQRLEAIAFAVLAVRVQIDEAGRHDFACGVDGRAARQSIRGDRRDASGVDADVPDTVEAGLGIDDAAASDHELEGLLSRRRRRQPERGHKNDHRRRGGPPRSPPEHRKTSGQHRRRES